MTGRDELVEQAKAAALAAPVPSDRLRRRAAELLRPTPAEKKEAS